MSARSRDELAVRIGEVLHYLWDPIGIRGIPGARDEYDSYVPAIVALLEADAADAEVVEHLVEIETKRMGLRARVEQAEHAARVIRTWKHRLDHHGLD